MSAIAHFVASFREAAPYIQYLRGKTMVVGVTDSLLEGETLIRLAADLNLLAAWACVWSWYTVRGICSTNWLRVGILFQNTAAAVGLPMKRP